MIETLQTILENTVQRLSAHFLSFFPSLLAGLVILAGSYVTAIAVRWLVTRIFKGLAIDRFLRRTGLATVIDRSGSLRASRIVSEAAFWGTLIVGVLAALSAFNTEIANRIVNSSVTLIPKLLTGGIILVTGAWLAQYLGRGTLVWAVNEGLPRPRRLSVAVRLVVNFVAVVAAADQVDFARSVFLAAFIIVVGGLMFGVSLAFGLGGGEFMKRYVSRQTRPENPPEDAEAESPSLWTHL